LTTTSTRRPTGSTRRATSLSIASMSCAESTTSEVDEGAVASDAGEPGERTRQHALAQRRRWKAPHHQAQSLTPARNPCGIGLPLRDLDQPEPAPFGEPEHATPVTSTMRSRGRRIRASRG
jgi:hypothetical protein